MELLLLIIVGMALLASGYYAGTTSKMDQIMEEYYLIPKDKDKFREMNTRLKHFYSTIRKNHNKLNKSASKYLEKTNGTPRKTN